MKACHICEKIVRLQRSISCIACKKCFCNLCIAKYFPEKASNLLTKREGEPFPTLKVAECFACVHECACHKCKAAENVVLLPSSTDPNTVIHTVASLVSDEELVPESGLFRGRRVSELPLHLQRIYLKKKVLYSKHELSCLSNDKNIPEQQPPEQPEEKMALIAEEKEPKDGESPAQNNEQEGVAKVGEEAPEKKDENQMEEEEQPEDYESEFPSRRAAHLHNQADNSAINDADVEDQIEAQGQEPNNDNEAPRDDSMAEENPQNEEEAGDGRVEEEAQDHNNRSSVEQPAS